MEEAEEELRDPYCDPLNPIQVQFQEVSAAAYRTRGGIQRTPCTVSSQIHIKGCGYCLFLVESFIIK